MGMAEIAMEECPSAIRGHIKDIVTCSERIAEIVRGLSSHSQMAKKEDQTLIDLPEVLEDSLKMISMVTKNPLEVTRNYQPVEKMEANLGEIQLVFNHLLTNAFEAMKEKEGDWSFPPDR
jgi:signal transduction histidine kinase